VRGQLYDHGAAIRSLADELDNLLDEQLAAFAEEETRAARISAELEDPARLLTERESGLIDQRERLQAAEREIADGRRRLEELRVDAEALRAREQALAEDERKQALSEREALVGGHEQLVSEANVARERELAKLQEGLSAAMERAAEVERGLAERHAELARLRSEFDTRIAEVEQQERHLTGAGEGAGEARDRAGGARAGARRARQGGRSA
jgi:chromosome segregation ATPase